eukprot:scaffold117001_cov50-Phaeocystis_antarctica.AAC.3
MQDEKAKEEVQEQMHAGRQEEEVEVPEDLLRARLLLLRADFHKQGRLPTGYRSEVNSEGEQKIPTRSANPGRREMQRSHEPEERPEGRHRRTRAPVRIRAWEVVWGNAKIIIVRRTMCHVPCLFSCARVRALSRRCSPPPLWRSAARVPGVARGERGRNALSACC